MQRLPSKGKSTGRPQPQTAKSFSRYESPVSTPSRTRASTVQGVPIPDYAAITESPSNYKNNGDVFETQESETTTDDDDQSTKDELALEIDELPEELREMMESFLESLMSKTLPTPLTIEQVSELFQSFYDHSQTRIDEYIAVLASRYPGQTSRTPSVTSTNSALSRGGGRRTLRSSLKGNARTTETDLHQMLTPAEIRTRRKIKRQLEQRRTALEELLEKVICERVYSRLWRHRTTDDEERDEKLRSRAAALALVGVSLKELLSTAMSDSHDLQTPEPEGQSAHEKLATARKSLEDMNGEKYPLGKLNHLKVAHKNIVETLQQIFPSVSSADEVLPTLIYSIITSQPDSNHIISNFNYIQRFRNQNKIDGEAAYCLTNLEAAITFLETVDLSSIRSDETPSGPAKSSSRPQTPQTEKSNPMYHGLPSAPDSPRSDTLRANRSRSSSSATARPRAPSWVHDLRPKIGSENAPTPTDAVRAAADEALDAMHNALDNSFKFFFGKLKERQGNAADDVKILTPRTLEDAHKLVSDKPDDDDEIDENETARPMSRDENSNALLRAVGGVRPSRDHSVESGRSGESGRKVSFADSSPLAPMSRVNTTPNPSSSNFGSSPPVSATAASAVDGLRTLGSSLNPLKGWGGVGMMRGFGRSVSGASGSSVGTISSPVAPTVLHDPEKRNLENVDVMKADLGGIAPPVQRFLECKDGKELNGYDIDLLLRDYQRLAGALRAAGISNE